MVWDHIFFVMADRHALSEALRGFYLQTHRLMNEAMTREGVSFARMKLLLFIQREGSVRSADIVDCFGYAPRTVTEAIDAAEREGLVARTPDPNDRRVKNIALTEAGHAAVRQVEPIRDQWLERIFSGLSNAENAQLLDLVSRMNAHIGGLSSSLPDAGDQDSGRAARTSAEAEAEGAR